MTPDRITSSERVREVLSKADSEHSPLFISLTKSGKNRPFDCRPPGHLPFGPEHDDFPSLGRKQSPFATKALPSLEDLQQLLITDLRTSQQHQNDESSNIKQSEAHELQTDADQLKQLETLTDDEANASGIILSFPSPSLDDMCGNMKAAYEHIVSESIIEATVLPHDSLLSLQHSNEGTTFTTLLSGSVAWIIWPPTSHNLEVLHRSYKAFSEAFDGTKMDVCNELKDGVSLIQTVGEAIRLPPFCLILCLSLKPSILATYSVLTATQLVGSLRKIPLLLDWWKTELNGERKKNEFIAALLDGISTVLKGKYEQDDLRNFEYPYTQEGPLFTLLQSWNEVKHTVASVLEPTDTQRMVAIWTGFLSKAKGRKCWLCGKRINSKLKDLLKHFEKEHWPAQNAAEEVRQFDKTPNEFEKAKPPHGTVDEKKGKSSQSLVPMKRLGLRSNANQESAG